jgi:hypothetical protein
MRAQTSWIVGLVFLMSMAIAQPATTAQIEVAPATADAPAVVVVRGQLVAGDVPQFRIKAAGLSNAVVVFLSDGGSLVAGIRIGQYIRMRAWFTLVPPNTRCASACAIAWLGGVRRVLDPTSQIGFHAAYTMAGGLVAETGAGNAVLGAYLNELGLSESAVLYITRAAPQSMQWLSIADAARYGIEVETLASPVGSPAPEAPSKTELSLEQRSAAHINSIMATWSGPNTDAVIDALQRAYSAQVNYYGKQLSREDVLADKRKFIERWPQRKYVIRTQSLATSCERDEITVCTVTGTVDYVTSSAQAARSQGSAQFEYRLLWTKQGPIIAHEAGKVIDRTGWRKN